MSASPPAASSSVWAMSRVDGLVLAEPLDDRLDLARAPWRASGTRPDRSAPRPSRAAAASSSYWRSSAVSLSNITAVTRRLAIIRRTPAAGTPLRRRRASARPSARSRRSPRSRSTARSAPSPGNSRASSRQTVPIVAPGSTSRGELRRAGDVPQPREQPHGHAHATRSAAARACSSSGSAVAPSIQTSPPSKYSCFQIGAICLTRSIA